MPGANDAEHKSSQWLQQEVRDVDASAREVLQSYSGIRPSEVVPHVVAIVRCVAENVNNWVNANISY